MAGGKRDSLTFARNAVRLPPGVKDKSYTFDRSKRLGGQAAFAAVYAAATKFTRGPLVLFSLPNSLPHCRLGLSVSRRVGTAPRRNRIKRLLRDAFRLTQHDLPAGYDLVIVVRPHEPLTLVEYQAILTAAAARLHQTWKNRAANAAGAP
jgi:ribonuclease P protein component